MNSKEQSPDRRTVLKHIAGGLAGGSGIIIGSGSTGAMEIPPESYRRLADRYRDTEAVRHAIQEHAGEVLALLERDGVVNSVSADLLKVDEVVNSPIEPRSEMVRASAIEHRGVLTGEIFISRDVGDEWVELFIMPEAGHSYAVVKSTDGALLYDPEHEQSTAKNVIASESYTVTSTCIAYASDCPESIEPAYHCEYREVYCSSDGCYSSAAAGVCKCCTTYSCCEECGTC